MLGYHKSHDEASKLAEKLRTLGGHVRPLQMDVRAPESIEAAVRDIRDDVGRIDILVNDAAYDRWVPYPELTDLSLADWSEVLAVNLTGPFACIRAVAPIMRNQGQGRIVNIASIAGLTPAGGSIAYGVSKAGLIHLTRCMAVALAPDVLVNCVAPGFMEGTRMTEGIPSEHRQQVTRSAVLGRPTDLDDVADVVLTLCRTNSMTGQTVVVDAGRVFH